MKKKSYSDKDLREQVLKMKDRGEKLLLKKRKFLGFDTGFTILNNATDGFQDELYLLAGGSSMGKTTFVTQLCWQMCMKNESEDLRIIYLSLDQKAIDITAKFVAQAGELPVDYVLHPFPVDEELDELRIKAISKVSSLKERITVIDEEEFSTRELEDVLIAERKAGVEKLFVIIDPLFKIKPEKEEERFLDTYRRVMLELKKLSGRYGCGILITYGLSSNAELRRPERRDLLEIPEILSIPYVVMSLYCDYMVNFETPFLEWDWSGRDIMVPISELNIIKNKMSFFMGRLFYRYFASLSLYRECVDQENENYSQMIGNIVYHKEKAHRKDRQLLEKQLQKDDKVDV
ncbi:MAG: DnaB-like helicase C-terminal domain-containing protein [Candidatus Wallbacteria bacterium]|nr:DnaB-like helicase C-terminal domain-containing protein [Candidatus Wallbacteria bacterium]